MARKIVIDTDPGIDDAIALSIAMFDPEVEIIGLTSVAGNASAQVTARNLRGIVEFLDPPKLPRIGQGEEPDSSMPLEDAPLFGPDALGGFELPVAPRCNPASAEKVICDAVRRYPHEVTLLTCGPLTNVARAFRRDPEIALLVDRVVIAGGTYLVPGNVLPMSEFNMYCDPVSAQIVFESPCHKAIVPLDVTNKVSFSLGVLQEIPPKEHRFGDFLHKTLRSAYRIYRQRYGVEQLNLQAPAAYFALTRPGLFKAGLAAVEIETTGTLTRGATVFDRRIPPQWSANVELFSNVNEKRVCELTIERINQTDLILSSRGDENGRLFKE
ncbi:MAG: nucleoside hydrolase [Thermoguttaceae bacterium]|nr:nucleoside hydrolase [Thermoguttaceae bacterium]